MKEIPASVRIAGREFSVTLNSRRADSHLEDTDGYCDYLQERIVLSDCLTPGRARETLLHEVIHAVNEASQSGLDERQVAVVARGLWAAFRDTPGMVEYLSEG